MFSGLKRRLGNVDWDAHTARVFAPGFVGLVLGGTLREGARTKVDFAVESDYAYIRERDHHILERLILSKIKGNEI